MPCPVPQEHAVKLGLHKNFSMLYGAVLFLGLHWALVLYINSSFLEQFVPETWIGILYTVSSAVTVVMFLCIPRILRRTGNYTLTVLLTFLEMIALIGMAVTENIPSAVFLFFIHQAIVPVVLFNLDIFMEEMIGQQECSTGSRRGLFLALMSFAGGLAPLVAGQLVDSSINDFTFVYLLSAVFLLPFLLLIRINFKQFHDPTYSEFGMFETLRAFWKEKDIRNVFFGHFLLQFFFAWMVIYIPLYLASHIGFSWSEIGSILFIALMAYVLLEYPIGIVADRFIGEKEMMSFGFFVLAITSASLMLLETASMFVWMVVMFLTRVGASFVEVTTESYFFKQTKGTDSMFIGLFRITRPFGYMAGAFTGSILLIMLPFSMLFLILGILMIPGFFFAMALKDTR